MGSSNFYGKNSSIAIENIVLRKNERLNTKKTDKGVKSALIVQGGSMRGVFSAGALIALERMGFSEGFDAVYSSSGGAMNAAYFLSKQSSFGASIYYENANNSNFINIFRMKKIVDIDYLFNEVIHKAKPLKIKAITDSKTKFNFFVTDVETGQCVRCTPHSNNFLRFLKASCSMPVYCNKTVSINGKEYSDGGISMAIPIREAIKDGCTDILVLLTQSIKSRDSLGNFERLVHKLLMPEFRDFTDTYLEDYKYSFDLAIGRKRRKDKVNIASIVPDSKLRLNRLSKNEALLKNAAMQGASELFRLFKEKHDTKDILKYS